MPVDRHREARLAFEPPAVLLAQHPIFRFFGDRRSRLDDYKNKFVMKNSRDPESSKGISDCQKRTIR